MLVIEKYKEEIKNHNIDEPFSCYLSCLTTNQEYSDGCCYREGFGCDECMRISLLKLLEEYKEPNKLTRFEHDYLKFAKEKGFNFIARDSDDRLFIYSTEPYKTKITWQTNGTFMDVFSELFNLIKWEDEKPWKIEEILNNCEVVEDE